MPYTFLDIAVTPSVEAAQTDNGSADLWSDFKGDRRFDSFTDRERHFIAARDSFYMATVSETGWPYVQHRGGAPGFIKLLDDTTLGFADFRGNRQYISLGNLAANDRASLILMDYPNRRRLKIYASVTILGLDDDPALTEALSERSNRARPERLYRLRLAAFDWNCPQHITPRYSEAEVRFAVEPLQQRLRELEAEVARLRTLEAARGETAGEEVTG